MSFFSPGRLIPDRLKSFYSQTTDWIEKLTHSLSTDSSFYKNEIECSFYLYDSFSLLANPGLFRIEMRKGPTAEDLQRQTSCRKSLDAILEFGSEKRRIIRNWNNTFLNSLFLFIDPKQESEVWLNFPYSPFLPACVKKGKLFRSEFELNKADLGPFDQSLLDLAVRFLSQPHVTKIKIEGGSCEIGAEKYNLKLSQRRAEEVANYLETKGLDKTQMEIIGIGEIPLPTDLSAQEREDRQKLNRRVDIIVEEIDLSKMDGRSCRITPEEQDPHR
jgi:hypothetical protein